MMRIRQSLEPLAIGQRVTMSRENYVLFTKRTEEPKLGYLVKLCHEAGLRVEKRGMSFHAPTTYVHVDDEEKAWEILDPIDDLPDDDPMFQQEN